MAVTRLRRSSIRLSPDLNGKTTPPENPSATSLVGSIAMRTPSVR